MESYQETVLRATKLSFFLIENEIDELPVGANLLFFLVSYLESLLIAEGITVPNATIVTKERSKTTIGNQ